MRELGVAFLHAYLIHSFASLALVVGCPERAARLLGAGEAVAARVGWPLEPAYRRDFADPVAAAARAALGEARFATARAEGERLSEDAVFAEALAGDAIPAATTQPGPSAPHGLTMREAEIVGLIAEGLSNAEIAARLVVSVRTVERHIENVYAKLGLHGRTARAAVTAYAARHALLSAP